MLLCIAAEKKRANLFPVRPASSLSSLDPLQVATRTHGCGELCGTPGHRRVAVVPLVVGRCAVRLDIPCSARATELHGRVGAPRRGRRGPLDEMRHRCTECVFKGNGRAGRREKRSRRSRRTPHACTAPGSTSGAPRRRRSSEAVQGDDDRSVIRIKVYIRARSATLTKRNVLWLSTNTWTPPDRVEISFPIQLRLSSWVINRPPSVKMTLMGLDTSCEAQPSPRPCLLVLHKTASSAPPALALVVVFLPPCIRSAQKVLLLEVAVLARLREVVREVLLVDEPESGRNMVSSASVASLEVCNVDVLVLVPIQLGLFERIELGRLAERGGEGRQAAALCALRRSSFWFRGLHGCKCRSWNGGGGSERFGARVCATKERVLRRRHARPFPLDVRRRDLDHSGRRKVLLLRQPCPRLVRVSQDLLLLPVAATNASAPPWRSRSTMARTSPSLLRTGTGP